MSSNTLRSLTKLKKLEIETFLIHNKRWLRATNLPISQLQKQAKRLVNQYAQLLYQMLKIKFVLGAS